VVRLRRSIRPEGAQTGNRATEKEHPTLTILGGGWVGGEGGGGGVGGVGGGDGGVGGGFGGGVGFGGWL